MSKDDKTRTDLSHLGPPAIARRFSQVSPRDEIAKFEKVPVSELGKPALRSADRALADANALNAKLKAALDDAIAEVNELKSLLGARDEALASALKLAQSPANAGTAVSSAVSKPPADRKEYMRQMMRDRRAAKKLGLTVAEYRARDAKA